MSRKAMRRSPTSRNERRKAIAHKRDAPKGATFPVGALASSPRYPASRDESSLLPELHAEAWPASQPGDLPMAAGV